MADLDQEDADALDNDQEGSYCEDGVRRPMNAFFIFCKRHRDVVREKYPHLENRSITKILGEWWANLDSSEKSSYTALARQYKEAFMKAHPDFKWYKLPSVPTRTLMTRPSNNRCPQMGKKDKNESKSSLCGIALGKLADDEHLGGVSSLLLPNSCDSTNSSMDLQEMPVSPCPVTSSSSCNVSKPPKKRYLEFMWKTESGSYDKRDDRTQSACSALLELAEICVNTANHSLPNSNCHNISEGSRLFEEVTHPTYKPSLSPINAISTNENDSLLIASPTFGKSTVSSSSCNSASLDDLQEQPLNLCKVNKGKMFTTSNQQLIDHVVNKFLCQPKDLSISPASNNSCQSFTLSAAIESTIDQAYGRDKNRKDLTDAKPSPASFNFTADVAKIVPDAKVDDCKNSRDNKEVVFIDKIKKACLASSRKSQDKPIVNCNSSYLSSANADSSSIVKDEVIGAQKQETETNHIVENKISQRLSPNCESLPKKIERKFSSSKYYSKFLSPPKKSQVWCNLFMREQLQNSDSEESSDNKKSMVFNLASPVRRKSQRTCKGRRYQALITQGLLQSTKERKAVVAKKGFSAADKVKVKNLSESVVLKSKKKKREFLAKSKSTDKEEEKESEGEKDVFDLNEKIASLPKCSIETLNKKRKSSPSDNTRSLERDIKKTVKDAVTDQQIIDAALRNHQLDTGSSGRFKSGSFDLEQHIASLPKCDIEVLNKRRSRKE